MYHAPIANQLFRLRRYQKIIIVASLDICIAAWAAWAAIYLRIGQSHWLYGNQLLAVLVPVAIAPPIFYAAGLYRTIFRHTSATDVTVIVRGCVIFGAIYASIFTIAGVDDVPRTVGLIQPILMLVTLIAARDSVPSAPSAHIRRAAGDPVRCDD